MAPPSPFFFQNSRSPEETLHKIGKESLLNVLKKMLLIRNFEIRAEAAYQQGKIGGFFHSYIGQEAIQTSIVQILGVENWYVASYRVHALALLLGATPNEIMAELFGKETGNAKGRGGSMHLYTERLLGGFGIVGGQIPIATGAAFSIKYLKKKEEISVCFFGEGAVAQGAFHESLNLASLWNLPCLFVIENNQWGMGTHVNKAISIEKIAEKKAAGYGISGYTVDGMDFFSCYNSFEAITKEIISTKKPVLVEVLCERFRGHSVSDPGLYRTKESLTHSMQRDPILSLRKVLIDANWLTEEHYKAMDKEQKEIVLKALKYAEESPLPSTDTLEKDVFAP